jgi:hypothetical protein
MALLNDLKKKATKELEKQTKNKGSKELEKIAKRN